ncbi:MAG: Hsp70 family protein [Alphaproteobacteria bacterium]
MHSCGIDFGTSNSAIAVGTSDGARLLPVESGSETMPSAIFYPASSSPPAFGRAAQKLFFEGEEGRFMRSLKRILGTALMGQGTVVNGKLRPFDGLIGNFISHVKKVAEAQLNHGLTHAVMGRPVHFIDGDAEADARAEEELRRIATAAGFTGVAFQFEPVAAAFAHEARVTGEKRALVADIGGGTSDFTVIKVSKSYITRADRAQDILGHSGVRLGGNDFDKALSLGSFMPALGYQTTYGEKHFTTPLSPFHDMSEWSKVNFLYTPKTKKDMRDILQESHSPKRFVRFVHVLEHELGHRLLAEVESAKIELTSHTAVTAPLEFVDKGLLVNIARENFDDAIRGHVTRIGDAITECLNRAGCREDSIEIVILTGGPTETPLLKQAICKRFPKATLSEDNKLSSVALGLGYDSVRKFGS